MALHGDDVAELARQLRTALQRAARARDELINAVNAVSEVARVLEHESNKARRNSKTGPGSGAAPGVRLAIFYWAAFSHLLEFEGENRVLIEDIVRSMGLLSYEGDRTVTYAALRATIDKRRGVDHDQDERGMFLLATARSTMERFKKQISGLDDAISSKL